MQPQSVKLRVRNHRDRLRAAGLKLVQIWIPDPKTIGFADECRRQSHIILNDSIEMQDLELLAEIADWNKE